jgi:hypothetical protein
VPASASSLRFAEAARRLADACRAGGLVVPGFRSPPALAGAQRTLRRRPDGAVIVAVRVRGRTLDAVVADLVEGVIAANGLTGAEADAARAVLRAAVDGERPAQAA